MCYSASLSLLVRDNSFILVLYVARETVHLVKFGMKLVQILILRLRYEMG